MERWLMIQEEMDQILFDVMRIENEAFVEAAKIAYEQGIEDRAEGLFFSAFLSYHFKDSQGKTLFERHLENNPNSPLNLVTDYRFSVYEVRNYPAGMGVKDIFTKTDYLIQGQDDLVEGDIMVARVVSLGNDHFINEDFMIFPHSYKDTFVKGIMEKYNEYCSLNGLTDLEAFLREQPLVLMKFVEILNEVEQESYESEEDYLVYQSVYLIGDPVAAKSILLGATDFDVTLDESGFVVARIYADKGTEEETLVAELVLDGNRIEIEALDEFRQNMAKEKMKQVFGEVAVHFQDEVVSMDDLF